MPQQLLDVPDRDPFFLQQRGEGMPRTVRDYLPSGKLYPGPFQPFREIAVYPQRPDDAPVFFAENKIVPPVFPHSFFTATCRTVSKGATLSFFPFVGPSTLSLWSNSCQDLLTFIFGSSLCQTKSSGLSAAISDLLRPDRNMTAHTALSMAVFSTPGIKSRAISPSDRASRGGPCVSAGCKNQTG